MVKHQSYKAVVINYYMPEFGDSFQPTLGLDLKNSAWDRLQYAYENCDNFQYTDGHYGKYEDGKLSVCGIGFAMRASGATDEELLGVSGNIKCALKTMLNNKAPSRVMKEYGFDDKTRKQFRTCPHEDCAFRGTLQFVLEHVNEAHKTPIPMIGKYVIPALRDQEKSYKPTLADQMILMKRDFISLFKKD